MTIDVNHVEIHTASVELKMITVNQRQMTLSVFRQIPAKKLIDGETFKLNGVPWGWVNYFWPDIKVPHDASQKIQVVWQKDQTLFRSVITPTPRREQYEQWGRFVPIVIREASNRYDSVVTQCLQDWAKKHGNPPHWKLPEREGPSPEEEEAWEEWGRLAKQYNSVVKDLFEMDQLFIAVGGGKRV